MIWKRAVNGDKSAEEEIFRLLFERFTVLAGLVMCKEDAEDVANEACTAVLNGYKSLEAPFEYNAWAQRILKNKIANYFQRRSVEERIFSKNYLSQFDDIKAYNLPDRSMVRRMVHCLRDLTKSFPRYARAINLVQLGFNTSEICDKMNVSRDNLYVILNRGRKILKECIFRDNQR